MFPLDAGTAAASDGEDEDDVEVAEDVTEEEAEEDDVMVTIPLFCQCCV